MVLKPVGTQNTPKKQYNMDTRIAKNPSEIPQSHNDFGEFDLLVVSRCNAILLHLFMFL